ncbi:MAG: DUF4440 domain-containing protein [Sphingomonadales bacterium]|jgi:hypothetical protein
MRFIQVVIFSIIFMIHSNSLARDHEAFGVVQEFFGAMSSNSFEKMKGFLTPDFHLLEAGEVWDKEVLVNSFARGDAGIQRRNFFSLIKIKDNNSSVWISYWNKAILAIGDKVRTVRWLESAIMVKKKGIWKIQMLHSTRLQEKQSIPEDVELIEYVN